MVWTSFWARSRTAHLPEDIQSNKYISLYDLENLIANLMEAFEESLIDLSSQVNLNLWFDKAIFIFKNWVWSELVFELGVERHISLRTFSQINTLVYTI